MIRELDDTESRFSFTESTLVAICADEKLKCPKAYLIELGGVHYRYTA